MALKSGDKRAPIHKIYCTYKSNSRVNGRVFELTFDEFSDLVGQNCVYCGQEPMQIAKTTKNNTALYNGIDRIDSAIGYVLSNCAPACKVCNYMKGTLGAAAFINHCKKVSSYEGI